MRKYLILILIAIGLSLEADAATREEMEHARALVLKWGVRSMNTGSGYLDGAVVSKESDLDKAIASHSTEKSNKSKIALGGLPSEKEYQEWDNAKMTEYWLGCYESAVPSTGKEKSYCKTMLRKALRDVPATVKAAEPQLQEADPSAAEEESNPDVEQPVDSLTNGEEDALASDLVENAAADPETEPVASPGKDGERSPAPGSHELKTSSGNGWLIFFLIILVIAVLALVAYATQVMARNRKELAEAQKSAKDEPRTPRDGRRRAGARPAESSAKEEEPLQEAPAATPLYEQPAEEHPRSQAPQHRAIPEPIPAATSSTRRPLRQPRIIFLSQANADGVFLRADAQFSPGNSIFKLVTTDGYSGTYSVIDDPSVHELALMMPVDFLAGACTGRNLQLVQGARTIVNDSTGTAIFEEGRWRVARKAQIHYTH